MSTYKLISSDSHIVEPPDLWQERIDPKFKDRAPHMVADEETDQWYVDGNHKFGSVGVAGQAGQRFEDASKLSLKGRFELNVPRGGWDPHAHVEDMDMDHIAGGAIFPTEGLSTLGIPDSDLLSAVFRAYNDWLADFCKPYPHRLKGIAMVNLDDVSEGIEEMERCAKMGMPGTMIATAPLEQRYDHPIYEPFWAATQDLSMPLNLHAGCIRAKEWMPESLTEMINNDPVIFSSQLVHPVMTSLAAMIFGGVFERYPKLRVGAVEFEVSWVPYFLNRMDDTYKHRVAGYSGHRFQGDALPSDFFRSNVFVGFQEDDLGMQLRHIVGVDNLVWGSDYPHGESTFPKSREIVERILEGVPEDEKAKIAGGNCARLYNFDI